MKKFIVAMLITMLFSTAVYAQSVNLKGDVSNGASVEVTNLEDGYYDIMATCKNTSVEGAAYLYGVSDGSTMASTVLPLSADGVTVTVKGVRVYGGDCEVGISANNKSVIEISDVEITKTDKPFEFIKGGDISEVSYIESLGGKYYSADGEQGDPIEILAENGMNMARIRLSNNTGKGRGDGTYYLPEGFQDEADCLSLAKRADDAGMGIQFTFNYSDYWSNGSRQIIPSEWVNQIKDELGYDVKDADFLNSMTAEQRKEIKDKLAEIVYDYTFDIMTKLEKQGTIPEYVSLGNEIRGGMLFPFGNTYDANLNRDKFELVFGEDKNEDEDIKCPKDWDGLVQFINAGYEAVKAVSPDSKVIIHLDDGSKVDKFTYFLDELNSRGANYDVIGASYYPAWTNNSAVSCKNFCSEISAKYDKDIMIMETGFNWNETRKDGFAGQLVEAEVYKDMFPPSKLGHMGFMAELFNELKGVTDGRCIGAIYWDPCMIHVEDPNNADKSLSGWAIRESDDNADANVVENTTLFDFDGKVIPSVDVFRNSNNSTQIKYVFSVKKENGKVIAYVKNNSQVLKTVALIIVSYDENGMIKSVKNEVKSVIDGSSETLSLDIPTDAMYKIHSWNGEKLDLLNLK